MPGLVIDIEGRITKLEQSLKRANDRQRKAAAEMEARARSSARKIEAAYQNMGNNIGAAFKKLAGPAIAIAGVASIQQLASKLNGLANDYREIENTLRGIGETTDGAAEKLAGAAMRSGAGLQDMAGAVARIQKASEGGYDETIRRVETLTKLLAVGGASAEETSSVVSQLGQALSSGVLQGDELRSLREAAPVELLDAIARAAGTTRAQLKDFGADGKLTSDIILKALDDMAAQADASFGKMDLTAGRAANNMATAMTTFFGRLDEGTGLSQRLATAINDLAIYLNDNADAAEQFGRSLMAGFDTAMQLAEDAGAKLSQLADMIREGLGFPEFEEQVTGSGVTVTEALAEIVGAVATLNGAIEGAAEAAREAFLKIPDAISGAMQAAINAIIGGVESMVNRVLDGVRTVAQAVDSVTAKIPGTEGTNLAAGIGTVTLGRVSGLATNYSTRSIADAYEEGRARGEAAVNDLAEGFTEYVSGAYQGHLDRRNREGAEEDAARPSERETVEPEGTGGAGGGGKTRTKGGKGGGKTKRAEPDLFESARQSITDLERQLQLIGLTNEQVATMQAKWALLDEAKKRGIPVNAELNAKIEAQAAQVGKLTGELERAEIAQDRFDSAIDGIAGAMAGALTGGQSLREGLADVFKGIAQDILKAGIKDALVGQFGGAGSGFLGGLLGWGMSMFTGGVLGGDSLSQALRGTGAFGFATGGYTGDGPKLEPAGVVHKGEFVLSKAAVERLGVGNLEALHQSALKGYSGGGLVGDSGKAKKAVSSAARAAVGAPSITISSPVTVNGGGGTFEQNADLAKQISAETERAMCAMIQRELVEQMRPGNVLSRR